MSVQSEINRISGNVTAALAAIAEKGVTVDSGSNSDDLATLIAAIEVGGGGGGVPMAIGQITASADTNEIIVAHNLGVVPNFAIFNVENSYSAGGASSARQAIQFNRIGREAYNWTFSVGTTSRYQTSSDNCQTIAASAPLSTIYAATIYGATESEIRWGSAEGKAIIRADKPIYWMVAKIPEEMRVS